MRVVTRNLLPVLETEPEHQVLLGGVESATFLFYDGTGWTDTWDSEATSTLPSAVRLSLVLGTGDKTRGEAAPIDLVVPILVTTTTSQTLAAEEAAP